MAIRAAKKVPALNMRGADIRLPSMKGSYQKTQAINSTLQDTTVLEMKTLCRQHYNIPGAQVQVRLSLWFVE